MSKTHSPQLELDSAVPQFCVPRPSSARGLPDAMGWEGEGVSTGGNWTSRRASGRCPAHEFQGDGTLEDRSTGWSAGFRRHCARLKQSCLEFVVVLFLYGSSGLPEVRAAVCPFACGTAKPTHGVNWHTHDSTSLFFKSVS